MKSVVNLYSNLILAKLFSEKSSLSDSYMLESTNGQKILFSDFLKRIDDAAIELAMGNFKVRDKVLFLAKPSIESIVYIFAIIRAGGVLMLADPAMGKENFSARVAFAKPDHVLIDPALAVLTHIPLIRSSWVTQRFSLPDLSVVRAISPILVRKPRGSNAEVNVQEATLNDDEDSIIIFTSGTTGTPKAVVHTYRSLSEVLSKIEEILNISKDDIFYSSQLHFLLAAILSGAKAILPAKMNFNAKDFAQDLHRFEVTKTFGIPNEYTQIVNYYLNRNETLPLHLKTIVLGSAPVLRGFLMKMKKIVPETIKVLCVYGATEILPISCVDMDTKIHSTVEGDLLGVPVSGVDIQIIEGEICVSGSNLFNRYLGFSKVDTYHTGDMGVFLEGKIVLLGRKKDMIIRRNFNIYPSIFESTISTINGVGGCAMVGIYNETDADERVYLAIEKDRNSPDDDVQLIKRISEELSKGKRSIDQSALPDKIILMKLPVSGRTKKNDKARIKEYIITHHLC
jgi:acyl-CoA synthetase (AMP-forming)/AMP-acid ligase II